MNWVLDNCDIHAGALQIDELFRSVARLFLSADDEKVVAEETVWRRVWANIVLDNPASEEGYELQGISSSSVAVAAVNGSGNQV